jgi:hypothetical protein
MLIRVTGTEIAKFTSGNGMVPTEIDLAGFAATNRADVQSKTYGNPSMLS